MWVKLSQLHKSKFVKCFMIAIVLVFSYEVNKPKAIAPLLPYVLPVVGGLVIGELAEMGVKWGAKAVVKKQSDNFAKMALNEKNIYGFDFMKTNPYRNKDGSLVISPSVNDMARIAGLTAGGLTGLMLDPNGDVDGDGYPDACVSPPPTEGKNIPWKLGINPSTGKPEPEFQYYLDLARNYIAAYVVEELDGTEMLYFKNKLTGVVTHTYFMDPVGSTGDPDVQYINANQHTSNYLLTPSVVLTQDGTQYVRNNNTIFFDENKLYSNATNNKTVIDSVQGELNVCQDLLVPSTIEKVYPAPIEMSSSYVMPNAADIQNPPMVINNVFAPSTTEGDVTWVEVQEANPDPVAFSDKVAVNADQLAVNGDINNNPLTIGEVNNFYTDYNYDLKVEEFNPPVDDLETEIVPVVPEKGEPVSDLDHSMWEVMRNTYNYLDDGIDSSLTAMKGITDSAQGITSYLNQTMGWLPPEWRAVFTSAFVLGVFAHFLRR